MQRDRWGYHRAIVHGVGVGARYLYRLGDQGERPDPASRSQPDGVHAASEVVDPRSFPWTDGSWFGVPIRDFVIYELHVGTFTPEGTFDAIIPRLTDLKELGITAIEIMPVAQFPGERNWGYDGVYPFAVQASYGGVAGLQRLVDACHAAGLALILDVVYNHLGPEGNYLSLFGPYFTGRYRTPWGESINFDGEGSDHVRRYFIENALYWLTECHVDALRLDAIHTIVDASARPFLAELAAAVRERAEALNRRLYLIAESDLNDPRVILPPELNGLGLDAQWADDLHHSIHAVLTGERTGYYADFGGIEHIARAWRNGYAYTGQYSVHRGRRHGRAPLLNAGHQFVVATQTHDQVGNRKDGDRLSTLVSFEDLKLAAGTVLLSPFLPMLFMGEEYAEPAPFQFFTSHSDRELIEAVRKGRREEFASFGWEGEVPDPQDEGTFLRSGLRWDLRHEGSHAVMLALYRELLHLRRSLPSLARPNRDDVDIQVHPAPGVIAAKRWRNSDETLILVHYGREDAAVPVELAPGMWRKTLDSADARWLGPGSEAAMILEGPGVQRVSLRARSVTLYHREISEGGVW